MEGLLPCLALSIAELSLKMSVQFYAFLPSFFCIFPMSLLGKNVFVFIL